MTRLPDLVRDSKLETHFLSDCSIETTVHTYHESDATSRRRVVARSEHWKRKRRIGGGGYSTVWLEECPQGSRDGIQVRAVKQIETGGRFRRIDFNRELETIAKFSHPRYERCFVQSFGWYRSPDHLWIAMEYLELGDMLDYLEERPALPESEAQEITFQILEGLKMMHENEFTHRDLKPRNILIKSQPPEEWWIKIADFGISKRIDESPETSTTLRGTAGFIAPELYGFTEPGSPYATDIWSLGEIAFQMLTKAPAFKPIGRLSSYTSQPERFPATLLDEAGVSKMGIEFVRSLMRPSPDSRLTAEMAILHPWIKPLSQIPPLPRAEALFQSVSEPKDLSQVSRWDKGKYPAITEASEESETVRPKERPGEESPGSLSDTKEYGSVDADAGESAGEAELTRSRSSLAHRPKAPSISSGGSKASSSVATSISRHTSSSDKFTEDWWTDHLKHAGLLGEFLGDSPKKSGSRLKGNSDKSKTEYKKDKVENLGPGRARLRAPSWIKNAGTCLNESATEDSTSLPRPKPCGNLKGNGNNYHRASASSGGDSDVRFLADSLMPSISLDGGIDNAIGRPGPSTVLRPPLAPSHSADNTHIEEWCASQSRRARLAELDTRARLESQLIRSRTKSDPHTQTRSRTGIVNESRDPTQEISALPLIDPESPRFGRSSKAVKRGSSERGRFVDRIAAGFGLRNDNFEREKSPCLYHDTFKFRFTLPVDAKKHRQISFCPLNLRLVTVSNEHIVEFWSVPKQRRILAENIFKSNSRIAVSPDGTLFASTSGDCLNVWNSLDGFSTTITSTEVLKSPQFSHDGTLLAATSNQKKIHIWRVSIRQGIQLRKLNTLHLSENVLAFAFQVRKNRMVVALNNIIRILGVLTVQDDIDGSYQFDSSVMGKSFKPRKIDTERGLVTTVSADGRMAAQAQPDGLIGSVLFIRDLKEKAEKRSQKFVVSPVIQTMCFSSSGEMLATSTKGRDVILWNVLNGQQALRLESCHETSITCMFLADEGQLLATCSSGEGVRFWGTDRSMERIAEKDRIWGVDG